MLTGLDNSSFYILGDILIITSFERQLLERRPVQCCFDLVIFLAVSVNVLLVMLVDQNFLWGPRNAGAARVDTLLQCRESNIFIPSNV